MNEQRFFGGLIFFLGFLGGFIGLTGCSDDARRIPPVSRACEPGRTISCTCTDNTMGSQTCNSAGTGYDACQCGNQCTPDCAGRACGPDPMCGESCGDCSGNTTCTDEGQCIACTPDCSGRACGPDPTCGVSCGDCSGTDVCTDAGQCMACTPDCSGRMCGPDPVCGTACGGACPPNATCSDAGQCVEVQTLTLTGWTALSSATVRATVGPASFETTTTDGAFSVTVEVADPNAMVMLSATGDDPSHVLVSVVGLAGDLLSRAGIDQVLNLNEHANVRITEWSTVRYGALRVAAGGQVPMTSAALSAAEHELNLSLNAFQMMEGAAILRLIRESPAYGLPTGAATLRAMAENPALVRAYIDDLVDEDNPDQGPLVDAVNALVQDDMSWARFEADRLTRHNADLLLGRNDYIGNFGAQWAFGNGSGSFMETSIQALLSPRRFTWTLNEGRLTVDFFGNRREVREFLSVDEIANLIPDAALAAQARAALDSANMDGGSIRQEWVSADYALVSEGPVTDHVFYRNRVRWYINELLSPLGVSVEPADEVQAPQSSVWHRQSALTTLDWTPDRVVGTWALRTAWPADRAQLLEGEPPLAGDPTWSHTLITMNADGSGAASGGVLARDVPLTWVIDGDGTLVLSRPGGLQDRVQILVERGIGYGTLVTHDDGSAEYVNYGRAAKIGASLAFNRNLMVHPVGQYWQTTINLGIYFFPPDGSLAPEGRFGFRFDAADTLGRFTGFEDPPESTPIVEEEWNHTIAPDEVRIDWYFDQAQVTRCTDADPSCYLWRQRSWRPLMMKDNLLYVLEQETWVADWGLLNGGTYVWDPVAQAYTDPNDPNRPPLDDTLRRSFIFPRLNAYYLAPFPQ